MVEDVAASQWQDFTPRHREGMARLAAYPLAITELVILPEDFLCAIVKAERDAQNDPTGDR